VAFEEFHVSSTEPPDPTIFELAVIVAVGAMFTVTLAMLVPPA